MFTHTLRRAMMLWSTGADGREINPEVLFHGDPVRVVEDKGIRLKIEAPSGSWGWVNPEDIEEIR